MFMMVKVEKQTRASELVNILFAPEDNDVDWRVNKFMNFGLLNYNQLSLV